MAEPAHVYDCIVVGGGQSGVATGYYLRKRPAVDFLILDDQDGPGAAWRHMWPSMTLFSAHTFSNLPGMPMPSYDGYPPASHVVDYLASYEQRYDLPMLRPVTVDRIEHRDDCEGAGQAGLFTIITDERTFYARTVVMATGTHSAPFVPAYPGRFRGRQWHSANYPGSAAFHGESVAVVGGANSGAQIAAELALDDQVGEVRWFTRQPPRFLPDHIDGVELFRRNRERYQALIAGKQDPGPDTRLGDIVVLPHVRQARDSGAMQAEGMFDSLNAVTTDHLVWCTGFRPALRAIRGLDHNQPGLFFVGYGDWVGPGAATIMGVSVFAKHVAKQVKNLVGDPTNASQGASRN